MDYRLKLIGLFMISSLAVFGQVGFEDVASTAGIDHHSIPHPFAGLMTGGAAWFDYNNDGWEDLYLTTSVGSDKLYENNTDGTFTDVTTSSGIESETVGVRTMGVAAGDLNRDGFDDLVVSTDLFQRNLIFINNGDGTFTEQGQILGVTNVSFSFGIALADYNQDGWLDIYFANWIENSLQQTAYPDRLYRNNANGSFTDVTISESILIDNGCGLAPSFSDFDTDGDVDLLVANDFGYWSWTEGNVLFENDNGSLTEIASGIGFDIDMNGMAMVGGDFDEDQDFDYYITNINGNALMVNQGGQFVNQAVVAGVACEWNIPDTTGQEVYRDAVCWGAAFMDYDNDSYIDLFTSNGKLAPIIEDTVFHFENRLYRNLNASGSFEDVSVVTGMNGAGMNKGCAMADYDHDGDMDIVVVELDTVGGSHRTLLMNNVGGNDNNWLEIDLTGTVSNTNAIGSLVCVHVDGRTLIREVDSGGSSYLSHHSKVIHIGLGDYESVDSIAVVWPTTMVEKLYNVQSNQRLNLVEEGGNPVKIDETLNEIQVKVFPNPAEQQLNISQGGLDAKFTSYILFDALGRNVLEGNLNSDQPLSTVDLPPLPSGVYFLNLTSTAAVRRIHIMIR